MISFKEILQKIDQEISFLKFEESPYDLFEPIEYILALGGKRIRPALTLAACNIYSDKVDDSIMPALSLEVFHNFTLLHDDLMDKADVRRGKPTVHKVWSDNTAILSGDAMLIVAYRLISNSNPAYLKQLLDLFTKTALEICEGQQYDMNFESRLVVEEIEYLEMIKLKTAVLLACALKMGAIVGGASNDDAEAIYQYGINLGLAFQLKDDLLDVYGDPEVFGKKIGGDILCNKKTFLLIKTLENSSEEQKAILFDWMAKKEFNSEEKITIFKSVYDDLGIKTMTEQKIDFCYEKALSYLSKLNVDQSRLKILFEINDMLLNRQV